MKPVNKPWGSYEILHEDDNCKVKKLIVKPGQQLSLQYHYKRQEHWVVVDGEGEVIVGNEGGRVTPQQYVFIPYHANHRLCNTSAERDLVIIETQTGEYFGEDDIVRLEDVYNRVSEQPESKPRPKRKRKKKEVVEIEAADEYLVP